MHKLILFELNEVPLRIIDYYISMRPNSWLAKNYSKLNKYETYSENRGHLSPWNTWPTLHRGVANDRHYIGELNQDLTEVNDEFPAIWDILRKQDISVGVFGSLHSYPVPESLENLSFYVPDVFSPEHQTYPKNVELFQQINLKLSRLSGKNVDTSIPIKDVMGGIGQMAKLGFTGSTVNGVAKQLVDEKLQPWKTTRRRTYQSVLSFDVFMKLLRKNRPGFTTFFTNHVASSLHRYWAAVFPDEYEDLKYDEEWLSTYSNEILFAMDHADKMLRRVAAFVDKHPEHKLLIASSMGQEAVESEPIEFQLLITDADRFLKSMGLEDTNDYRVLPAMVPQFNYQIREEKINDFEQALKSLKINGNPVNYRLRSKGHFSIDFGHANLRNIQISLNGLEVPLYDLGLDNVEIADKSSATAYHIPEGHLFSYHPSNTVSKLVDTQMPTTDLVPMILRNYGLKPMEYMNETKLQTV